MSATDPYTIISEPTFVARFLLSPDVDTEETVANVDAFVDLPDGSTWALTIFTVAEVSRLLARYKKIGEVGIPAMVAAIRELVRSGEIVSAGIRCDDVDAGPAESE